MAKLDASPYPDDLQAELAVQPRRQTSRLTLALAAGVVLVAGILIGIQAHKSLGGGDAGPAAAAGDRQPGDRQQAPGQLRGYGRQGGNGQPPGYGGPGGQPGFGQRQGGGTVGTVEKVEDGKVYLKTMDGATVTVTTTGQTTVQVAKPGKVSDLRSGSTVVVRGEQAGDGTVSATSITQGGVGR
ncbi:hypothetical protein ABZ297_12110 [Nonomuraea sp. NPDC005983]|uniref:hypothetical protein n=1 Tax=Nonomuraea sp. NPDC005983 TaxID=3155595 RepID=UPI0033ABCC6D